mgnify:CR=1 FL=1
MATSLDDRIPSIGARNSGIRAVAGSGSASVHQYTAMSMSRYAHLDI